MVDSPDTLRQVCLQKFADLVKSDQRLRKRQLEEKVFRHYLDEKAHLTTSTTDQQKRKQHRGESFRHEDDSHLPFSEHSVADEQSARAHSFIEYFLRGHCRLNCGLSEDLVRYFIQRDQFNDLTFSLFTSNVTCLRRLVINIKYLSRLECHILNQHPTLTELEIIFRDSNLNRPISVTNESFYQHICPSFDSSFEEIYSIYAPFIIHHRYAARRRSISVEHLPHLSDAFSHQKLLNVIFNNLHPMTTERLKILSLSHYQFFTNSHTTPARKYSLIDMVPADRSSATSAAINFIPANLRSLMKFTNLTSLNLSETDIKNPCLDIITDSLRNLDTFDLSSCRSLKFFHCLLKLSSKLKWLNLYNCLFHFQQNPSIYHILYQLKYLEYLDLSTDNTFQEHHASAIDNESDINRFLRQINCLPRLKHFDISGQKTISANSLQQFLIAHPTLQFLGLFLTSEKYSSCIWNCNDICYSKYRHYTCDLQHLLALPLADSDLLSYEPLLFEALRRYNDRASFVQKILYYIFFLTRTLQSKQQNVLIDLILHVMSVHASVQAVQLASTACIYNLTRTPITEQLHVKYLTKIVQGIMNVMATFATQQQIQKNCLLTLCSDRILHEPHFDFYLLATLVMNNLHNHTDLAVIQPGVAILSLLTTRLTIEECTQLGSVENLRRLLRLIEEQVDRLQNQQNPPAQNDQTGQILNDIDIALSHPQQLTSDDTLRFCLSLLWNLTDENIRVCECFIESMGLQLFQRLLQLFSTDNILLTKIVGLLSNIAEVSHLKVYLHSIDIISIMRKFMLEAVLDIAFPATGTLAHLLFEQTGEEIDLNLCREMRETILAWQNPHTSMVTYRSFQPFLPLLQCARVPVVQLWAVWAIHHVCSTDRTRYYRIIREEKMYDLIENLYETQSASSNCDAYLLQFLKSLLHLLRTSHQNASAVAS